MPVSSYPKICTSPQWLESEVDAAIWSRGLAYFRDGMVDSVEEFETPGGHFELFGYCQGSRGASYEQEIAFILDHKAARLVGECSCPVGFNCKHVVAIVLEWQSEMNYPETTGTDPVERWLNGLATSDSGPLTGDQEALLYLIEQRQRLPSIIEVQYRVAKPRANGEGWTRGRNGGPSTLHNPWSRPRYLGPADEEILGLIRASERWSEASPTLTGAAGGLAFNRMIDTGRCFLGDDLSQPVRRGPPRVLDIAWQQKGQAFHLDLELAGGGDLLDLDPPLYLDADQRLAGAVQCPDGLDARKLLALSNAPPVPMDRSGAVARRLALVAPELPTPVPVERLDIREPPVPVLSVDFDPRVPQLTVARATFAYADQRLEPGGDTVLIRETEAGLVGIERDLAAEEQALAQLPEFGLVAVHGRVDQFILPGWKQDGPLRDAWFAWIDQQRPGLKEGGWQVELVEQQGLTISQADGIHGEVEESGNDWFSLRFDLEFNGWVMPLLPLVSELLQNYRSGELPETLYLNAGQGHFVAVPSERIEPVLDTIIELFDRVDGDTLELQRADAARLDDLDGIPVRGATSLRKLAARLRDFSGLSRVKLPTTFKGVLRDYQQQGLDWLQFLRENGFGGILADDMGLGKTIQTLAHLAVEKRSGRMKQPCLIVAPTSLMSNWQREAAKFTPKLSVLVLQGPDRFDRFERIEQSDLVLTTYPLLPRDRDALLGQEWHYLILDEAQQIKNPKAQAAQVVRHLKAGHRLCLTGTPMENHLSELWAQFDFLMPGFLGEHEDFRRHYRTPIEKHGDGEKLQRLTRRTAPFLLRRTKDLVAAELPPKTELLRTVTLGDKQAMLYESVRLTMEKKVRQSIANRGLARSHIIVLEALLKLRQVCCDPRLLPAGTRGAQTAGSAKFELLFDLLPELIEEGRRVLLFSQFTTMLGLIEKEVIRRGIDYTKLTGQTRKRDLAIDTFRSGQANLFLISLKAGGVGLNLTEADTVIHYDPWWNPAVEHQATDRAHRIGQDKPVFVYKLVAEGTVEERILALQERKQQLAKQVYGKGRAADQPPIDEATIEALLAAV